MTVKILNNVTGVSRLVTLAAIIGCMMNPAVKDRHARVDKLRMWSALNEKGEGKERLGVVD